MKEKLSGISLSFSVMLFCDYLWLFVIIESVMMCLWCGRKRRRLLLSFLSWTSGLLWCYTQVTFKWSCWRTIVDFEAKMSILQETTEFIFTAHKRTLGPGNFFYTCLSVQGWVCIRGGLHPVPSGTRKAGGTHPTAMLSCYIYIYSIAAFFKNCSLLY